MRRIKKLKGTLSGYKTAVIFGIDHKRVYDIWNGKAWTHVV